MNGENLKSPRYPLKNGMYSSHSLILRKIKKYGGNSVLDLGCGAGLLASKLLHSGQKVIGIELDPNDARTAQSSGLEVFCGSVEDAVQILEGTRFDVIVAADILEHLSQPEKILNDFKILFNSKDSYAVISIPNIANITIRLQLLFGQFNYTDRGILDRTHLRFFTKKSLLDMLRDNGFEIIEFDFSAMPLELLLQGKFRPLYLNPLQRILRLLTKLFPTILGYQSIVVIRMA